MRSALSMVMVAFLTLSTLLLGPHVSLAQAELVTPVYAGSGSLDMRPSCLQRGHDLILCAFDTDDDGTVDIKLVRSVDGGATWGAITTLYSSPGEEKQPSLLALDNGDLLCAFSTNEQGGFDVKLIRSTDDGGTWGSAVTVYAGSGNDYNPHLVELTNGDILAVFHTNEDGNDDIKVVRSTDNGSTWGLKKTVYKTSALERWPVIMQLSNGDVLSVFATQEGGNWNIALRRSLDDGYTWGGKVIMYSGPGVELGPSIIQLANGNLLTAFETNEGGTWDSTSMVSSDNGYTWKDKAVIYGGPGHERDPILLQLADGRILSFFHTDEDGDWDVKMVTVTPGGDGVSVTDLFDRPDSSTLGNGWEEVQGDLLISGEELKNAALTGDHLAIVPALSGPTQRAAANFASADNSRSPRFGVLLRFQDPQHYYLVYRQIGSSSFVRISKVVNGVETPLATTTIRNPHRNRFFRLEGRAEEAILTLDLDGKERLSVSDATFADGTLGIILGSKSTLAHRADDFNAMVE